MFAEVRRWFGWTRPEEGSGRPYKWVIEPVREGFSARVQELWRYRRILFFLSARAIKSTYEGMTLGIFWLFARPLLPILISAFIFGRLLQVPSENVPYFLFFLTGQAAWYVFEQSLLRTTRSLDQSKGMLKKVYFPRLMAPVSSVAVAVAYFGVFMGLLLLAGLYYWWKDGVWYLRVGPELLLAPLCTLLTLVLAVAIGLFTSIWQVRVREVRYTLRYFTRFWSYLTPIIYPMSLVPAEYRWMIYANPMAPLVEGFKWAVLGIGTFPVLPFVSAVCVIAILLSFGLWFFNRYEAATIDRL